MPSKIKRGRTPQEVSSSSVTSDAPMKKRMLRKMIIPSKVEEEEEEEVEGSLVRRTKVTDVRAQKVV